MNNLAGRVALVTGGGRGIGAATAELLAERGAAVAVVDLELSVAKDIAERIKATGGNAVAISADVVNRSDVRSAVERTVKELGTLDMLVCSAGVTRDNLMFRMTDDEWQAVITTHLTGSFLCSQAAQAVMVPKRYGKIVLLSSTSALGNRGQLNYAAAKAGIQAMARTMAIELGAFNINVNVVAPGFVSTRMTMATAEALGVPWEDYRKQRAEQNALKKVAEPADIAKVIAFFCSDDSGYVTGQTLYARGGP